MSPRSLLAVLPLLSSAFTAQQGFALPEGLEASLWAESPQLFNPTAIDVDERGRVWVSEAVNYRKWRGRNRGLEHPDGDRVVVLEDVDGDGRCDTSTVFVQERALVAPLGICVVPDGAGGREVYVSASPDIVRYTDRDGDDVPEKREVFLTGFGGHDHDHGVHSLVLGADGYLYGAAGNAGPHLVTDRSGWSLRSGSLYRGGGEFVADNKPGLVSDDGRVWTGGLMFRVHPRGDGLQVLGHNFRNPYEIALDAFGNLYTADNDDDGNASCRTLWVLGGADHGYVSKDGSRTWQADRRPGQETTVAHWHGEDPGVAPPGTINGAGGPTGVAVYEAALLDPWIGGAVLNADAGAGVVYVHRPRHEGAGVVMDPAPHLIEGRGEDLSSLWFRPSDVAVGMDGEVYVADWYDPGVGGHAMGDREAYGRLLRVAPTGFEPRPQERAQGRAAAAVNVRNAAWASAAEGTVDAGSARDRARAVQSANSSASPEAADVVSGAVSDDPDPRVRAAAVRLLSPDAPEVQRAVMDVDPMVRRAAALRLRGAGESAASARIELARRLDPDDPYALEAFGLAAENREAELWERLEAERGDTVWGPRRRAIAWRLHPEVALEGLLAQARDGSLSIVERRRMLDAVAFLPTQEAASAMAALALAGPAELRELATFWARHRATNDWRAFELAPELAAGGLEDAERVFQSALVSAGLVDIEVELESGDRVLWLVVTDGGNGNGCDWADWIEPRFLTAQGEVPLTGLDWLEAQAQWGEVRRDRNAGGGPLLVDGEELRGIGTHAASRIAFSVPEGATHFRARGAADDGGTSQSGAPTSVVFEVHVEKAPAEDRLAELESELQDGATLSARRSAASALAADPMGGMRLVRLTSSGRLDEALRTAVVEGLAKNPDLAVRALAAQSFPALRRADEVRPEDLLALKGEARRGAQLFFDPRANCSDCHAIVRGRARRGGDVGPELTHVREKLAPSEILNAILKPSEEIAFGFDTWMIEDRRGRLFVGFLLGDGEQVLIKDTQGRRHAIDADQVQGRWRQEISTMPEGLAMGLGAQDLADLVAFLAEDPERAPRAGPPVTLFDGESLDGWVPYLPDASVRPEEVWSVRDGVLVCSGKPAGYLRTSGSFESFVLSLEWRFDPVRGPGNSGVLLRLNGPDGVWPRSIEAQLQSGNAGDIWNIEEMGMEVALERTRGRHTSRAGLSSELPLGEWNRYVITLDGERLTLEVNGVLQNEARWCEQLAGPIALQSEGAEIHFRNIELREILD